MTATSAAFRVSPGPRPAALEVLRQAGSAHSGPFRRVELDPHRGWQPFDTQGVPGAGEHPGVQVVPDVADIAALPQPQGDPQCGVVGVPYQPYAGAVHPGNGLGV